MPTSDEGANPAWLTEHEQPDSVDLEFGNEYSEETLELLRGVQRPEYLEESSSLDPVEDLELYVENNLNIPPATYDALVDEGRQELQELQAVKDHQPDAGAEALVRYRQRLTEGTSHKDMAWLKLRAYHRAMDELNAMDNVKKTQQAQELLQEYDVPVDQVPADLLRLTPAQLAERQQLSLIANSRAAAKAERNKSLVHRLLSKPDPSEESEWVGPNSTQPEQHESPQDMWQSRSLLQGIQEAFGQHRGPLHARLQVPAPPPAAAPAPAAQLEPLGAPDDSTSPVKVASRQEARTIYTQAYLDRQALQKRLQKQKKQRSAAFWLSFATVSGAYLIRHLRKQLFKKPPPPAGKRTATLA